MTEIHAIDKDDKIELKVNGDADDVGYLLMKTLDEILKDNKEIVCAAMAMVIVENGETDNFIKFLRISQNAKEKSSMLDDILIDILEGIFNGKSKN